MNEPVIDPAYWVKKTKKELLLWSAFIIVAGFCCIAIISIVTSWTFSLIVTCIITIVELGIFSLVKKMIEKRNGLI